MKLNSNFRHQNVRFPSLLQFEYIWLTDFTRQPSDPPEYLPHRVTNGNLNTVTEYMKLCVLENYQSTI